jgi:hypothetical protein|tara:strand:- start:1647 stop:3077 length:1431 start_codon:yes stop_codon:yes gene_type:complete
MKNKTAQIFFGLVAALCCFQVSAQIEIENKIVDFGTLMPIESASVYVQGTTIGVVSNVDGKFALSIPEKFASDTLVVSSIGYKSFKSVVSEFDGSMDIYLEEDVASLDEVLIVAETRPKTGNDIVIRAIEELEDNLPEMAYLQKGFLRHKERNKVEYKWLIESALTVYDSSYAAGAKDHLKINIDENRKSYDLRDVDSLYAYTAFLKKRTNNRNLRAKNLRRDTIKTASLVKAIRWNDERVNGLDNLFKGKLNMVRNANATSALFGKNMLDRHQFRLDTVLVENDRKLYKIEISKGEDYVGLNTPGMYNEGFEPKGWLYIYWDTFAFKKIEYELVAASKEQKSRSKSLFGTLLNHKLVINYQEFEGKMYPNYIYYETPKLVNIGDRSSDQFVEGREAFNENKDERYYNTIQEIVFTEVIQDREQIAQELDKEWSEDIFSPRPYNKEFWKNYNVLLESEEEEKLIQDLSKRASLFKQ